MFECKGHIMVYIGVGCVILSYNNAMYAVIKNVHVHEF